MVHVIENVDHINPVGLCAQWKITDKHFFSYTFYVASFSIRLKLLSQIWSKSIKIDFDIKKTLDHEIYINLSFVMNAANHSLELIKNSTMMYTPRLGFDRLILPSKIYIVLKLRLNVS